MTELPKGAKYPRDPFLGPVDVQWPDSSLTSGVDVSAPTASIGLYTSEQRARRDATRWTLVQGILAPLQFLVCIVSAALVLRYLATGQGLAIANLSVLIKTGVLLLIMVTGSIWEKVVFDEWLFAKPFFWEDVVSMGVIALHLAYVAALLTESLTVRGRMLLALVAYAAYVINAVQFVLKLRAARLQEATQRSGRPSSASSIVGVTA
ncbi:MAG: 2-vinyl bacteriochlorophyllide hydratase [Gemmatimonadota bacterium]